MYMRRVVPFVLAAFALGAPGCGAGGGSGSNPAPGPAGGYRVRASQAAIPFANGFAAGRHRLVGEADATGEWAFYADPASADGYGPYVMEGKTFNQSTGAGNRIIYKPIGAVPTHSSYAIAGTDSPYSRVIAGQHLVDPAGGV